MNTLDAVLNLLAATSWRIGLLIVLCLGLRRVLRGRLPAAAIFAVWLVLAGALLVPVGIPARWSPFGLLPRWEQGWREQGAGADFGLRGQAVPASLAAGAGTVGMPRSELSNPVVGTPSSQGLVPGTPVQPGLLERLREIPGSRWATLVWLTGVMVLVLRRATALVIFSRKLRRDLAPADGRTGEAVERCRRLLGIRGEVTSGVTSLVETPALHGIRSPRLLMPAGMAARLSDEELELIVLHELGHVRRRDLLAQTLLHAAAVLHWFNPLAWLAVWAARADCEHACDEFVLSRVEESRREAYGTVLLKVVGMAAFPNRLPAVLAIFDRKGQLKQRIERIAHFTSPGWGRAVLGGLLLASIAVISLTRESVAQSQPAPMLNAAAPAPQPVTRGNVQTVGPTELADREFELAKSRRRIADLQRGMAGGRAGAADPQALEAERANERALTLQVESIRARQPVQKVPEEQMFALNFDGTIEPVSAVPATDSRTIFTLVGSTVQFIRRPSATGSDRQPFDDTRAWVVISADGAVYWQGVQVALDAFILRMNDFAHSQPAGSITLQAADGTRYSQVFGYALNEVRKTGMKNVFIETIKGPPEARPVELAQAVSATAPGLVVLQVSTDGTYYWNQEPIAFVGLRERLTKGKADGTVTAITIVGDRNATFNSTVRLIDLLRELGIRNFSIETKTSDTGRGGGVTAVPVSAPQSVVGGSGQAQVMAAMGGNATGMSEQAVRLLEQSLADTQKRADDLEQRLKAGEAVADQYRVAQATLNDLRKRQEEVRVVMNQTMPTASQQSDTMRTFDELDYIRAKSATSRTGSDLVTLQQAEVKLGGYVISADEMVRTSDGALRVSSEAVINAAGQTFKVTGLSLDRAAKFISVQSAEFRDYRISGEKISFARDTNKFTSEGEVTLRTANDTFRVSGLAGDITQKVVTLRTAAFRDYEISSDKITLNLESGILTSEGETTVRKGGATFKAKGLSINLRDAGVMAQPAALPTPVWTSTPRKEVSAAVAVRLPQLKALLERNDNAGAIALLDELLKIAEPGDSYDQALLNLYKGNLMLPLDDSRPAIAPLERVIDITSRVDLLPQPEVANVRKNVAIVYFLAAEKQAISNEEKVQNIAKAIAHLEAYFKLTGGPKGDEVRMYDSFRAKQAALVNGDSVQAPPAPLPPGTVTVLGQVNKTGRIMLPVDRSPITVVDVIALAEGFNRLANDKAVSLTRIMPDGAQKRFDNLDVGGALRGEVDRKDMPVILPGDIINVPTRIF